MTDFITISASNLKIFQTQTTTQLIPTSLQIFYFNIHSEICIIIINYLPILNYLLIPISIISSQAKNISNDHQKPNWNIIGTESKLSASPRNYQSNNSCCIDSELFQKKYFCSIVHLFRGGEARVRETCDGIALSVCAAAFSLINWWVHLHLSEKRDKGGKRR